MAGERTLVVWCPDWPVVAAGLPASAPVAVMAANRVVACSVAARGEGVRRGLRRREAQARCPELTVVDQDPACEARSFEQVLTALEVFTPTIEVLRPGVAAMGTRGPSRYFGGDQALAVRVAACVDQVVGALVPDGAAGATRIGVADGPFAAELAARATTGERPSKVVEQGGTPEFLRPLPVAVCGHPELIDLLHRLGVRTLGQLAGLPAPAVLARFGPVGAEIHRLARGIDERPLQPGPLPPDLTVTLELDPPAERIDMAAFAAKAMADELHERLAGVGLACTRIAIEAETEHGEHLVRLWRHEGALRAAQVAERMRWQLDGWLASGATSAGITLLRLTPDEVKPDHGRQLGFWGGSAAAADRATRALARVQGLLGPEAVLTAVTGGGRDAAEQVRLVPWGDPREPARAGASWLVGLEAPVGSMVAGLAVGSGLPRAARSAWPAEVPPWPGRLPSPAPALLHRPARPALVVDAVGRPVRVDGRGQLSAAPSSLAVDGGEAQPVAAWAGPWPAEDRWWDPRGRRRARFQLSTSSGPAYQVALEAGSWWVEATYD